LRAGKVSIVGAGPGDPELLTVKALRRIESASTIVYDALIGEGIISLFPASATLHYAGKRSGRHHMRQEEINELLLNLALSGRDVLRLKGGDPMLFGRGGEEALFLAEHGVDFEIIPGISSALAAPLLANVPITMRNVAERVLIISAHGPEDSEPDWEGIWRKGQSTVFLMGRSLAGKIKEKLRDQGADGDAEVLVISSASLPSQKVLLTTVSALPRDIEAIGQEPAVIVTGEAVKLMWKMRGE